MKKKKRKKKEKKKLPQNSFIQHTIQITSVSVVYSLLDTNVVNWMVCVFVICFEMSF